MELDDLKGAWTQYDKKLTENLKFNEELFKKMNLDKSRREMNGPLNYEIGSVVISVISLIFIASWTLKFSSEPIYLASGLLSCLSFLIMLAFAIQKVRLLSNIDYYNLPILELQKSLYKFKETYFTLKKYEFILFPVYIIVIMPITAKGLRGFDILAHPGRFGVSIALAIGIGYAAAFWIYKHLYEKNIKNTSDFLQELKKFEVEG